MARNIKITGGVLNIRLHPHPDGVYQEFFEAIYRLKRPVKIRGEKYGIISLLNRSEGDEGLLTGFITTFTNIDTEDPWFDASSLKEATDNQISNISIPENLFPNSHAFNFIFDTNNHRLYVQTYSNGKTLSINGAQTLIETLSSDLGIVARFGEAKVTVVQTKAGLARVFGLKVIKRIIVTIEKPNADIFEDDFDDKMEEYLDELHTKKLTLVYEAEAGKSIRPNASLRRVGESALEHGSVVAEGRDDQGATRRSTDESPQALHDRYDPDETSENLAFRRLMGR